MIVKMKQVTILVPQRNINDTLNKLRSLGVVHITHTREPAADRIVSLEHKLDSVDRALAVIAPIDNEQGFDLNKEEVSSSIKEIFSLTKEKEHIRESQKESEEKLEWFKEWGDISSASIGELESAGVFVKLYRCRKDFLKKLSSDKIQVLKEKGKEIHLALFGSSNDDFLDCTEVKLPEKDMHFFQRKLEDNKKRLEKIENRLRALFCYRDFFRKYREDLINRLEFYKVRFGMAEEEGFSYLKGFCPCDDIKDMERIAESQGWAVLSETPSNPEEVPTLIKNPKWIAIIKPLFKFMGTLPGYKEFDISFWFLAFFSIFFAMLIGDAGYGVLFLGLTLFAKKKLKNRLPSEPFFLIMVLSAATILWGAVTGTWFGFESVASLPFLNLLVIDKLNSFVDSNQLFMMHLCFLIGVIHLTIAHSITAFRFINSLKALAQIGWICILWGLYFIAGKLVLDTPAPQFAAPVLVTGLTLAVLFSNPQKNFLKGVLVSIADLPLSLVSSFSDIVSYLRLFAVGYASVVVAMSFNEMALGIGFGSILSGLFAALILFLGHSLNILLGLMAVVVHGVRLNMLEFSGHLNMQWSGKEYRPFRE